MTDRASTTERVAHFENTGEKRRVTGWCRRCRVTPDDWPEVAISPGGMAHHTDEYGATLCGIDATGEKWWWKL